MPTGTPEIEEMTRSGLNLIKQALSIYDSDLKLVVANKRFRDMFDLPTRLTQAGASFRDTIQHLAERGDYGEISDIEEFVEGRVQQALTFEPHYVERTRPNGMTISVEGSPLRQGGWVAVYTDITEIKRQEALLRSHSADLSDELLNRSEELSQTNRQLSSTIAALEEAQRELTASQSQLSHTNAMIPAHIAHVDAKGVYTYSNRKLKSILPQAETDIIGKHFRQVLGEAVWEKLEPEFAKALRGQTPAFEFHDEESDRHIRVAFTPERAPNSQIVGVYVLSADVTDEAAAREALTHARRRELAAQITSGLAHDFSNLLTVILGQQDRLASIATERDDIAQISEVIKSAALRGGELVKGLGRIDARRRIEAQPVDLAASTRDIDHMATAVAPDNVVVTVTSTVDDPLLVFDPGFAQDALLNLVLNSVEAANTVSDVNLTISHDDTGSLTMLVEDNGPGFNETALTNALAPFFSTKGGGTGRGLGLPTAFDFAKSSGGQLKFGNRENGGAWVSIKIPYETAKDTAPGMVLLVEDDDTIRQSIRTQLRRLGHVVVETNTIEEAETLATLPDLSLIITDLVLGSHKTGYDFATQVKSRRPELPTL
ncbi:MAG: PAS-domain containing protein, partial [Boseongicola sp.]|nr:PAS-domain containing protein [Boseongicola sp.]